MSDAEQKPKSGPRWVKIALGVSLSINLLVAGLAVGTVTKFRKDGGPIRSSQAVGAYTFALSPQDRRHIGREMAEHARSGHLSPEAIRQEYDRMIAILVAEPFDRNAAQTVLDRQFEFLNTRRAASETLLLDRLEAMTQDEREAFAERLKEAAERRRPPKPRN